MLIELCNCNKYPDPHDHVTVLSVGVKDDGTEVCFMTYPDGEEAKVGDVIRYVDWEHEGDLLIKAISTPGWPPKQKAMLRFQQAKNEAGHALRPKEIA